MSCNLEHGCLSLLVLHAFSENRSLEVTAWGQAFSARKRIIIIRCHACIGITQRVYFFLTLWCDLSMRFARPRIRPASREQTSGMGYHSPYLLEICLRLSPCRGCSKRY